MKNKILISIITLLLMSYAALAQERTERFLIKSVSINNEFQNFGTTFFGENQIIYSSQSKAADFLDLYIGSIDKNGEIINPKKLEGPNTKYHESNVVFTRDQKTVYFDRSIKGKINTVKKSKDKNASIALFQATVSSPGVWTNIHELPFSDSSYDVGHPALSRDGKKLYFTSNMPGTLGDTDIFVVDIKNDGSFGLPKNMGSKVNSEHKEMFPYVDQDNILFYSSNRPDEGYGGLDIYAVKIYENADISDRIHLEPPINSIKDDFNYIFNQTKKEGYFSSNRGNDTYNDDIYFFTETRPLLFDCYQEISGQVVDAQTKKAIPFATVILKDANGADIEKITTEKDGKFSFNQAVCDTGYELLGEKRHYSKELKKFNTSSTHEGKTTMNIELSDSFIVKRRGKQMLNIDVINFDFNKSHIRPDAANQLDRVINTMTRYPNMVIELGTHTDARGKDLYNLVLSNKRAKSVIAYVVGHGISSDRISGKGYGEKKLINHCSNNVKCTEQEHEENRRSEFVITKI